MNFLTVYWKRPRGEILLKKSIESVPRGVSLYVAEFGKERTIYDLDIGEYQFFKDDCPSRSKALNRSISSFNLSDTIVMFDADLVFPSDYIETIDAEYDYFHPVVGWGIIKYLSFKGTDRFITGLEYTDSDILTELTPSVRFACGGVLIIERSIFDLAGGFNEGITSWGGEDNIFWVDLMKKGFPFKNISSSLIHLCHDHKFMDFSKVRATLSAVNSFLENGSHGDSI